MRYPVKWDSTKVLPQTKACDGRCDDSNNTVRGSLVKKLIKTLVETQATKSPSKQFVNKFDIYTSVI